MGRSMISHLFCKRRPKSAAGDVYDTGIGESDGESQLALIPRAGQTWVWYAAIHGTEEGVHHFPDALIETM
jgi:hypothetical protein